MASTEGFDKFEAYLWGIIAEWLAYMMVILKAYTPLERRWRSPVGEIDLIVHKNKLLVFIEVKARKSFDTGVESITANQRVRIENAARNYIASHPKFAAYDVRFDVMVVTPWRLPRHLEDAWRPAKS